MIQRKICRLLACMLLLSFTCALLPQMAWADDLQDQIDELRRERLAIAMEHDEKQAAVDELEEEKAGVVERKAAMDERNALTRRQIDNLQQQVVLYDQMIAQEAIKLAEAKAVEDKQLERYRVRVRAMEEYGELGYLGLLLHVSSFSELLTAMDDAGDIMKSDKELYDDYIAARENTEMVKAQYEARKTELEANKEELLRQEADLQAEIDEATQLILELEEDIDKRNEELHDLLLAEIAAAERIDSLVAEQERRRQEEERRRREEEERRRQEEAARQQQEQGNSQPAPSGNDGGEGGGYESPSAPEPPATVTGTGSWSWPCPGCTYITSRAGNRYHPLFGEWRYHSGIDIGAGYGSAVCAADSGTVIMASVNGGYGNCVMIDHGNGYYSLYGHLSGYAVSNGQSVSKGQTVGYVGDTGWATGPHLHFEVRSGGSAVDPEAVCGFYGLTYAPDAGD